MLNVYAKCTLLTLGGTTKKKKTKKKYLRLTKYLIFNLNPIIQIKTS